jgi:hypothetical protein
MITPPNHTDEDPDIARLHPAGAGFELELADEVGIDPSPALHGPDKAGGVPQDTGGDQDGTGGDRDERGGDDTTRQEVDEEAVSDSGSSSVARPPAYPIHAPGARVLEYFRREGTDVALMSREIMDHLGEKAETAMNFTVKYIHLSGIIGLIRSVTPHM